MGKVKKSKKFRKNHLKEKIDKVRQKQKVMKHAGKSKAPIERESRGFEIAEPKQSQIEDPELENLSDSEHSDDDELAQIEEQEYLNGIEGSDDESQGEDGDEDEDEITTSLTVDQVLEWSQQLDNSPKIAKEIIRAFSKEDQIADIKAVDALINLALGPLPTALRTILPVNKNQLPVTNKRLKEMEPSLKSYCKTLTDLLKNGTNKRVQKILFALQKTLPYFLQFKSLKDLIKSFVSVIVNPSIDDEPKLLTFSVIKEACTAYPNTLLEPFLKQAYESLVRLCKSTNSHTLPTINLAKNLFGMLYGIDASKGYQMAFQQIRTLALNLKAALDKKKNPDSDIKVIYTWQYVQSLDYFSRAISLGAGEEEEDAPADMVKSSPLLQLIHPLVQITLRTITLVPKASYLPLRFYLVRSLIRLCRHTGVYIPLNSVLLEVLSSSAINRRALKSSLNQFDFDNNIHAPESYINTQVYQNGVNEELVDLFAEVLVLYCKNIAFPEVAGPVAITVRRFIKKNNNNIRLNKQLQTFLERVEANSEFILRKRSNVTFGPRDKEQVAAFLKDEPWEKTPLGSFATVRRKVREERQRLLREGQEESEDEVANLMDESEDDGEEAEAQEGSSDEESMSD